MTSRLVSRARKPRQITAKSELERLRQLRTPAVVLPATFAQGLAALNEEERHFNKSRKARLARAWSEALELLFGERASEIAAHCVVRGSFGGKLRVSTDSPALAHELGRVRQQDLLARLRELLTQKETLLGLEVRAGTR
jgi:hypothetical protein